MAKDPRETASKSAQEKPGQPRQAISIKYVDRPDIAETFSDSVNAVAFDGQTLRIEFGVTRFDHVSSQRPTSGRRYPAARLVLTRAAALEMISRLQQMATAITQAGQGRSGAAGPAPRAGG